MRPERLAEILASIDRGDTWDRTTMDLAREVHRLRALPVTCGGRARSVATRAPSSVPAPRPLFDREDPVLLTIEHADVPPAGCPLRGGAR